MPFLPSIRAGISRWMGFSRARLASILAMLSLLPLAIPRQVSAQAYGLEALQPVGKFLDNRLPSTTPGVNGSPQPPALLSAVGAFSDLSSLTPRSGLIPYEVNSPLWTDGAVKRRWLAVPNDGLADSPGEKIGFSAEGAWQFPKGSVLVKEFDLPVDERNPSVLRRMETRFLVHGEDGVYYGVTYRWRADGSDADLLPDGDTAEVTITSITGNTRQQTWSFPGRADCRSCHNQDAGEVLGPRTHQLNGAFLYPATGRSDNQLRTLNHLGLFSPAIQESAIPSYLKSVPLNDPGAGLETRVRSYLDANCAHCHLPGHLVAGFDARFSTPLGSQNLVNGSVLYDLGLPEARIIAPQSAANSVLRLRLNALGLHQMPPVGRNTVDTAAVAALTDWINSLPLPESGGINRAPLAANDLFTTPKDTSAALSVLLNDSDPDNDPVTVTAVTIPSAGSAVLSSATQILYTPPAGFSGTATFSYSLSDGRSGNSGAVVTVQVLAPATADAVVISDDSARLATPTWASGVAMGIADMNGDGRDDIVNLKNGYDLRIQYQPANGAAAFTPRDFGTIGTTRQWGIAIGDIDNNGYPDIMTGGYYDGLKIFRANGTGTAYTTVSLAVPSIFAQTLSFADINNDGWLDIFACHDDAESAKFRNNRDGTFTADASLINTATVPASDNSGNYGVVWTDCDNDGDLDLYISKCRSGAGSSSDPRRINQLFRNNGDGTFTNSAAAAGLAFGEQSWVADFGDVDNDGDLDCFVGNHSAPSVLMRNNSDGTFTNITGAAGLGGVTWRIIQSVFRDFNNDGWLDLLLTGEQQALWINNRNGTFSSVPLPAWPVMESCAVGDLNHDGFTDIYAGYASLYNSPVSSRPDKLLTVRPNGNHFLSLALRGTVSNASGSGARLELHGPWGTQVREIRTGEGYGISHSPTAVFGLGNAASADRLRVRWPSGTVDEAFDLAPNRFLTLREGSTAAPDPVNPGDQSSFAGTPVTRALTATDPTGDALTWSAAGLPAGLALDPFTGVISGTPAAEGTFQTVVRVTDGWSTVARSFAWTIAPPHTPPAVALTSASGSVTGPFDISVTFSQPVTGLDAGSFAVTNGAVTSMTGGGTQFSLRIAPAAAGTVTVSLPAGRATGATGLGSLASNLLPVQYAPVDIARPGVVLSAPSATVTGAFPLTVSFTENVSGLTLSDFAVTNGSASALSGSGTAFALTINPAGYGDVTVLLPADRVTDGSGNPNTASPTLSVTWPAPNRPPVVTAPPAQATVRGTAVSLQISASDPDGNALAYTASGLPAGLAMDPVSGLISGTVSSGAAAGNDSRVTVTDGSDSVTVIFQWETTADAAPNGLRGEYFAGLTPGLAPPLLTRLDGVISFDWGSGSPAPAVPQDQFSVRWTGLIEAAHSELYHFVIPCDNGLRVWINDQPVIDQWLPAGTTGWFEGAVALEAGVRTSIRMEYYEEWGGAGLTMFWYSARTPWEVVPAERLFPPVSGDASAPSVVLSSPAAATGPFPVTATFSEPVSGLTADDFGITRGAAGGLTGSGTTWVLTVNPLASPVLISLPAGRCTDLAGNASQGSNTLTVSYSPPANRPPVLETPGNQTSPAGQGVRLELAASDPDGNALTFSATGLPAGLTLNAASGVISGIITSAPGTFSPVITVRDSANAAVTAGFLWTVEAPPVQGLRGEYYSGMTPAEPDAALLIRNDPQLDFDWGSGPPAAGLPVDQFSVRWTGEIEPALTDTYHFVIPCDNGLRVWIDNELIIDEWLPVGTGGWFEGIVPLQAGVRVPIRIEYYEEWGGAAITMFWYGAQQPWEVVPPARLYPPATLGARAAAGLPAATAVVRESIHLEAREDGTQDLCYVRPAALGEICRCVLEISTDFRTWTPLSAGPEEAQIPGGVEVRLTDVFSRFGNATKMMFRVRMTDP